MNLHEHSSHDVTALLAEWREVAEAAGLQTTELLKVEDWSIVGMVSPAALRGETAVYLSTGVHGDEAGSAWGLLAWARQNITRLRNEPFLLCPCLNPAGLANNTRVDHRGLDINRRFHLGDDPLMAAWQHWMDSRPLRLGLCLHEDYDAIGCYVYELSLPAEGPLSEPVMRRVEPVMRRDPRADIDGQPAREGIIQRREVPKHVVGPEAIVLYDMGCPTTMTFETPSEFAIDVRVRAHQTFIQAALEHLVDHRA